MSTLLKVILISFPILFSCTKDQVPPKETTQNTNSNPCLDKYAYVKGILTDSLTGQPANGVYMTQAINCGCCQQTIEVVNGEFFFTYCAQTMIANGTGYNGPFECGIPTAVVKFAIADTSVVNALTAYEILSAPISPMNDGDTLTINFTAIIQ